MPSLSLSEHFENCEANGINETVFHPPPPLAATQTLKICASQRNRLYLFKPAPQYNVFFFDIAASGCYAACSEGLFDG